MNNCFANRLWTQPSQYVLYTNISQVKRPAGVFVLLEERYDSLNDGCFFVDPDNRFRLIDYPACYHDLSANFTFADGHVELHRWRDPRTTPWPFPGQLLPLNVVYPGDVDVDWIDQRASELR